MKIETVGGFTHYHFYMDVNGNVFRHAAGKITEYNSHSDTVIETRVTPHEAKQFDPTKPQSPCKIQYIVYYHQIFAVPTAWNWNSEQIWDEAERQYKEGLRNNE